MARECPKREALNALIKKSEKDEVDARLDSMEMLGALQVMSKASSQGNKAREQTKVANPHDNRIIKGKEKSMGQRGRHSKPQKDWYQQQAKNL